MENNGDKANDNLLKSDKDDFSDDDDDTIKLGENGDGKVIVLDITEDDLKAARKRRYAEYYDTKDDESDDESETGDDESETGDDEKKGIDDEILTQTEKEQLVEQITGDSEYLKQELEKLSPDGQLEMMLNIYQSEERDDPEFLKKLQENYCFAETTLYKILITVGVDDNTAKDFSAWYLKQKLSGASTIEWTIIKSTWGFVTTKKFFILMALIVYEWIFSTLLGVGISAIHDFLVTNNNAVTRINHWIGIGIDNTQQLNKYLTPYLEKIPLIGKASSYTLKLIERMSAYFINTWTDVDGIHEKLASTYYKDIIEYWSLPILMVTGGVIIVMWLYYIISSVIDGIELTMKFCGENVML